MLGLLKIYQKRSGRSDSKRETVHGKALERIHSKLSLELLHRAFIDESPFFKSGDIVMVAVFFLCSLLISPRNEKFLRSERAEQGSYVVEGAFRHLKCTGGDIQKGCSAFILVICQSGNVVMLLLFEKLLVKGDSRGNKLRDASLYYLLGKFGIFQLVAHRHLIACTHKSRQICL